MRKPFEKAKEVSEDVLMGVTVGAIHSIQIPEESEPL